MDAATATEPTKSDAPPAPPDKWRRIESVYVSLLQMGFVFAVYVFSAGPMYWTVYESYTFGTYTLVQKLYRPLVLLAETFPWFSDFLDWWVALWIL